jgi:excisionase family DNA binding protein
LHKPEPLLTTGQVAEWLNISKATVLDWSEAGKLPSRKLGHVRRYDRAEIEAWIDAKADHQA